MMWLSQDMDYQSVYTWLDNTLEQLQALPVLAGWCTSPGSVRDLAAAFGVLISRLGEGAAVELIPTHPSHGSWDLRFRSAPAFCIVMSSIYPPTHSRHLALGETTVAIFQPEMIFRQFNISSQTPQRAAVSQAVASGFANAGQTYKPATVSSWPKQYRFILPMDPESTEPVNWWDGISSRGQETHSCSNARVAHEGPSE